MSSHPVIPIPTSLTREPRVAWSCVVDDTPQIWSSLLPWLATAIEVAGIPASRLHVHHVCPLRPEFDALCAKLGVHRSAIEPFDARSPHCNKIRQCETDFGDVDRVVLTDVDIAFARRPPLESINAPVAGKLVDAPNPPIDVLRRIFVEAGVEFPPVRTNSFTAPKRERVDFETPVGNFNGGVYVMDPGRLPVFGQRWASWAHWLLDRFDLLGRWRVHVDQVAFCIALSELGWDVQVLQDEWNFPTHLGVAPSVNPPVLLHHHGRLDSHLRLKASETADTEAAVAIANAAIESFQRRHFDNRSFWNHRYAHHPDLGSGLGSRGETLEMKRGLLGRLVDARPSMTVLDWGCGDLETTRLLGCADYTGVDLSVEALRIARGKRPDWRFATPEEFCGEAARDLVLCLDVLIHQPTHQDYLDLVERLVASARRGLVIAGYDRPPGLGSHITYFHEPLAQTLARMPGISLVVPLGEYRDTSLYFAATTATAAPDCLAEPLERAVAVLR